MYDSDEFSFSLISTAAGETVYTPTDQGTDDFEFLHDDHGVVIYESDARSNASTSITPSVYSYEFEHGRRYHSLKSGRYPLPNDAGEQRREETRHSLMLELTDGKLFLSKVDCPLKIIDIGTGSGTWAMDVADFYPDATVIGTDLSPVQPSWLPINLRMFVEDCEEDEWMHGSDFDLIHFREVAGVLRDVDAVLATAYSNLRAGGWVEFQELGHSILCDDGTMTNDDTVRMFSELYIQGMREYGCQGFGNQNLKQSMERVGFRQVRMITKKVPISTWPRDRKLQTLGILMKANIVESVGAFAAKPLAALGLTPEERKKMVSATRHGLNDKRVHRYVNCVFCYGQKPEAISERGYGK